MDSIPQKRCNRCRQEKPATLQFFTADKSKHDGLRTLCKTCSYAASHEQWIRDHPPDILPDGYKRCSHCKQIKPATLEYFYGNKNAKDSLGYRCKECCQAWVKEYGVYDPARRKHYYETHKDTVIQEQCAYAKTEAGKASRRRWKRNHPEAVRSHTRNRRAIKKTLPGSHSGQDILAQYQRQKGKCYYCNQKIAWGEHQVDHTFPVTRNGARNSIDHLVITCGTCNRKKGDKYPWEFFEGGRLL